MFVMEMLLKISKEVVPFLGVYMTVISYFSLIFIQTEKHGEKFNDSKDDFPQFG
jgi:hypothetical protein